MNLNNPIKYPFLLFIGCILTGILIMGIFSAFILFPYMLEMTSPSFDLMQLPREKIISTQIISMICFFILPPVLFALFSKNDFIKTFNLDKPINSKKYLIAIGLAFVLFPIVLNLQYFVTELSLPQTLRAAADLQEAVNQKIINLFLDYPGIANLLFMVLMIGVGAGVTEELFFRGLLMSLLAKGFKSQWAAIVISGFIFSIFHANVYNFLPILLVGILLGYIYYKTGDLKLNIFLHATYNSLQVILNYLFDNKFINFDIDNMKFVPVYIWAICLVIAVLLVKLIITKHENISSTN